MGMGNMQVQQSTQQGGGKGIGQAILQGRQQAGGSGAPMSQTPPPMQQAGLPDPVMVAAPMGQMPLSRQQQMQMLGAQGQQPSFGQPNRYSNTVPSWDNASIMPRQQGGGKVGKGGGGFERAQTSFPKKPVSVDAAQPVATGGIIGTMPSFMDSMGQ